MISMRGIVKRYGAKPALNGLDLEAREGEIFGLIGPNGAGKTTTMGIITGLVVADEGSCLIHGKPADRAGGRAGFLPEEPVFAEQLTGREYLELIAATSVDSHAASRRAIVDGLIKKISLDEAADRRVGGYSRGMRQRLGLACALIGNPELLVLDEPSSALDPEGRRAIVDLVLELKAEGRTVILSTHILSDIERVCDRVALIDHGRVRLSGSVSELLYEGMAERVDLVFARALSAAEWEGLRALPQVAAAEGGPGSSAVSIAVRADSVASFRIDLTRRIGEFGLPLVSLTPRKRSLEEVFLAKVADHA